MQAEQDSALQLQVWSTSRPLCSAQMPIFLRSTCFPLQSLTTQILLIASLAIFGLAEATQKLLTRRAEENLVTLACHLADVALNGQLK